MGVLVVSLDFRGPWYGWITIFKFPFAEVAKKKQWLVLVEELKILPIDSQPFCRVPLENEGYSYSNTAKSFKDKLAKPSIFCVCFFLWKKEAFSWFSYKGNEISGKQEEKRREKNNLEKKTSLKSRVGNGLGETQYSRIFNSINPIKRWV